MGCPVAQHRHRRQRLQVFGADAVDIPQCAAGGDKGPAPAVVKFHAQGSGGSAAAVVGGAAAQAQQQTPGPVAGGVQQQLAHAVGGGVRRVQVRSGQRQSRGGRQLHNGGAVRQQAVKPRRRAAIGARAGAFDPLAAAGRQKRLHRTLAAVGQGDGEHLCPGVRPPDGLPGHGAEVPGGQGALEGIGDENVFVHIAPPGVACCP